MDAGHAFLLVETAATILMSGVLWTMQLLNYPLLALVGREAFTSCQSAHNRRFGLVVFPGVLVALARTIGLLASRPRQIPQWAPGCELALVAVTILSTVMLQGRQHAALARGFDAGTLRGLVRSNWIRVIAGRPPAFLRSGCVIGRSRREELGMGKALQAYPATASSPAAASSAGSARCWMRTGSRTASG
jgi:hypothetical protein